MCPHARYEVPLPSCVVVFSEPLAVIHLERADIGKNGLLAKILGSSSNPRMAMLAAVYVSFVQRHPMFDRPVSL